MQISLNWINELVDVENTDLNTLIEKLTLGGFEVEDTFELLIGNKKETIFDISATANRADSVSVKGISKEIGALINIPERKNVYSSNYFEPEKVIDNAFAKIEKSNNNHYSTFITISIENITSIESPNWLKQRLISSGIELSNNLLDFQKYILLETGYPFEFYDLDKIKAKLNQPEIKLTLTKSNSNEFFQGENQLNYKLNENTLILKANNLTLSIAGILVNSEFNYDNETKSLLIEGSIFDSKKIRQTSRELGLRTDRSARYEKGLNNHNFTETLCHLLKLLKFNNKNLTCKINTISQIPKKPHQSISLTYKNIIEILGPNKLKENKQVNYITVDQISSYLQRLKFESTFEPNICKWDIVVPKSRVDDITREIDLIEEIGRLHGFNNFISYLPNINQIGNEDFSYQMRKKLITCFLSEGLNELIQYSLVNKKTKKKNSIQLINPLVTDYAILRNSLLPDLIKTISENLRQGNANLEGFEFGHVFSGNIKTGYVETEYIAGNFGGIPTKLNWVDDATFLSWFEAKGKLEDIFLKLRIPIYWKNTIPDFYKEMLHPYRTTEICLLNGKSIGIFGQIHPIIAKQSNINMSLYLFELNFEILKDELKSNKLPLYKQYSLYPKIIKDLSFIIDQQISFSEIKEVILKIGTNVLQEVNLLDEYQGKTIPENSRSLCIQLIFQSKNKTLRTKEIETIVNLIQSTLIKDFNIIQRF